MSHLLEGLRPKNAVGIAAGLVIVVGSVFPNVVRSQDYIIQSGDTLSGISDRFGIAVTELVQLNGIKDIDRILPGTSLRFGSGPSTTSSVEYRVRPGDTLSEVADRNGISVRQLMDFNSLANEDLIVAGATLRIPKASTADVAAVSAPAKSKAQEYRVQSGDSLSTIADRFGVSVRAIAQANSLTDSSLIRIGAVLVIPARTLGTPAAPIGSALDRAAAEFDVDPYLVRAVSLMESGWTNEVVSHAGAIGLMQLMPETARWAIDILVPGATNWRVSAIDNARIGSAVLKHLLDLENGNVEKALAAYYQGWTSIHRDGIFGETRGYVEDVLALRQQLRG